MALQILRENGETWLICGGRAFVDKGMFEKSMNDLMHNFGYPSRIVHGAATGADSMADDLGNRLAIRVSRFPANWKSHGRAAGPFRNRDMLAVKPDKVIAFPGGRGTQDMVKRARKAKVMVIEIQYA